MKNNLVRSMIWLINIVMTCYLLFSITGLLHFMLSLYKYNDYNIYWIILPANTFTRIVLNSYILYAMRKLFVVARDKHPFSAENIRTSRNIGIAVLLLAFHNYLVTMILLLDGSTVKSHTDAYFHNFILFTILGLSLLVLSRIFTVGSVMKTEQDLTV